MSTPATDLGGHPSSTDGPDASGLGRPDVPPVGSVVIIRKPTVYGNTYHHSQPYIGQVGYVERSNAQGNYTMGSLGRIFIRMSGTTGQTVTVLCWPQEKHGKNRWEYV